MYAFPTAGARRRFRVCPTRRTPRPWPCGFSTSGRIPNRNRKSSLRRAGQKAARRGWILKRPWSLKPAGIWLWQAERSQFPVPSDIKGAMARPACRQEPTVLQSVVARLRTMPGGVDELIALAEELGCESIGTFLSRAGTSRSCHDSIRWGRPGRTLCGRSRRRLTAQGSEKLHPCGVPARDAWRAGFTLGRPPPCCVSASLGGSASLAGSEQETGGSFLEKVSSPDLFKDF